MVCCPLSKYEVPVYEFNLNIMKVYYIFEKHQVWKLTVTNVQLLSKKYKLMIK